MTSKWLAILLLLTLVPFTSIYGQTENTSSDENPVSIIYATSAGEIKFVQITNTGSKAIWTKSPSALSYSHFELVDLDNDGTLELLALNNNEIFKLINLETGGEIWEFDPASSSATLSDIAIGDLTGNGNQEIFISRHNPIVHGDRAMYLIDSEGNELEQLKTTMPPGNSYGSDNAAIYDIDNDGDQELILSFGSVLWNNTKQLGGYRIEIWSWESTNSSLVLENSWSETDWGGNTRMDIYESAGLPLIITYGWYNNYIRAWDYRGNLIWRRQLAPNQNLRMSDTDLLFTEDRNGVDTILAFQRNSWNNFTNSYFELNPITGLDLQPPIPLPNMINVNTGIHDNTVFTYERMWTTVDGVDEFYYRMASFDSRDGYSTNKEIFSLGNEWGHVFQFNLQRSNRLELVEHNDAVFAVGHDVEGQLWLLNDDKQLKFTNDIVLNAFGLRAVNNIPLYEGEKMVSFTTEDRSYLWVWILLILIAFALISFFIYILGAQEFDTQFKSNWRVEFYLRLNKIVLRLLREKHLHENQLMAAEYVQLSANVDDDVDVIEVTEVETPKTTENFDARNLQLYSRPLKHFNLWLEESQKAAKKLKLGDLAILIEVIELHPEDMLVSDIVKKFDFAKRSTIYNRIQYMIDAKIIEEKERDLRYDDIRLRKISVTQIGIELMATLYISLDLSLRDKLL